MKKKIDTETVAIQEQIDKLIKKTQTPMTKLLKP